MTGFRFRYRTSGGMPTVQKIKCKDNETLTDGDIANLESGEIDLAVTTDANLLGAILNKAVGVDSTTVFDVITDADAVYGVVDNNARKKGATLDIAGTTGAQTVAASENKEFVVMADSSATEETLVRINTDVHAETKAQ